MYHNELYYDVADRLDKAFFILDMVVREQELGNGNADPGRIRKLAAYKKGEKLLDWYRGRDLLDDDGDRPADPKAFMDELTERELAWKALLASYALVPSRDFKKISKQYWRMREREDRKPAEQIDSFVRSTAPPTANDVVTPR